MPSDWKDDSRTALEKKSAFLALRESGTPAREKEHPSELPGWVKAAFVYVDLGGETYRDAAERFGRKPTTLSNYASSPAAKKWREAVAEVADDPAVLAKGVLEGAVADASADLIWARETARRAGDYKEVRMASAELLDRLNIQKKHAPAAKPTIVVNVTGAQAASIEPIEVEAEVLEDDEAE